MVLTRFPTLLPPMIGLLGGSFNPAHAGHVHISQEACKKLGIRHIWWMVSPQNPLKPRKGMADYATRMHHAREVARGDKRIAVTDIEAKLGTQYTIATLLKLKQRFPRTRFIWLMGADNLSSIHRWERWHEIFEQVPVLVLDRAPLSHRALRSKAAIRFKNQRLLMEHSHQLMTQTPPVWGFLHIKKHPARATDIRKKLGKEAFLVHN